MSRRTFSNFASYPVGLASAAGLLAAILNNPLSQPFFQLMVLVAIVTMVIVVLVSRPSQRMTTAAKLLLFSVIGFALGFFPLYLLLNMVR